MTMALYASPTRHIEDGTTSWLANPETMKAAMTSSLIESNIAYVCDRSYGVTWKEGAMMTWGALRVRARAHARTRSPRWVEHSCSVIASSTPVRSGAAPCYDAGSGLIISHGLGCSPLVPVSRPSCH